MTETVDQTDHQDFAAGTDKSGDGAKAKKNLAKDARGLIASVENDITIPFFSNILQPTDSTLIKRGGSKGLALYDEIENDTHAWAVLQKRRKTLLAREWIVVPGGEDQIDIDAAEFVEGVFKSLPFDRICEDLLDATLKGYAISEIVWTRDASYIVPAYVKSHEQRRFVFDKDWKPRLLTQNDMIEGRELPDRKFMVHRHGVKGNNAYGLGLGTRLFWPVLFKREGVAFWLTFLEKFAQPTVVGKVPYGLPEKEELKLLQSLAATQKQAALTVPIGTEVNFLEAARSGSLSYEDWCKYWDRQISVCVNGETLTTDIQGQGSRAAGEVHADMLQMLVDADGDLLSDTLRETIIKWLVEYNHPGAKLPSVWRTRPANEQAEAETHEKQAKASVERDKAVRQVVATSAQFENDDDARAYIIEFAPGTLDASLLDTLVAARFAIASRQKADQPEDPKKKVLTPEPGSRSDTAGFADASVDSDEDIQASISTGLESLGVAWDEHRASRILAVLDSAKDLNEASRELLREFTSWKVDEYADTIALALTASAYAGRDRVLNEVDETPSFADADVFSQPFQEQIDFFRQKAPRPTKVWTDILRGDHDRAFMIAGAKDLDMLRDFQEAIADAIENGRSLDGFRKDFDRIVAKYGWGYKGERGWRTKTIFETNVRTSYMAGRLKQMRDPDVIKARPYWRYRHGMTRKPKVARRHHLAWDGLILRHDDPFWEKHFPPNDWGCSCGVETLSERDLKRLGKTGPDTAPPERVSTIYDPKRGGYVDQPQGLGYGFEYQPGDLWERGLVPSQIVRTPGKPVVLVDDAEPIADLIANGKPLKAKVLRKGKEPEYYVDAFLGAFGAVRDKAALFKDKAGGAIPISDELFREANGDYKILKRGREVYAAQLAEAIQNPDEIWIGVARVPIPEDQGGGTELVVDRKYIRVDPKTGLLAIFELLKGRWSAKTAFNPTKKNSVKTDVKAIDRRRNGVLVYKRK